MPEQNYSENDIAFLNAIEEHHFWYRTRRHLLRTLLRDVSPRLPAAPAILDLGCGNGSMVSTIREYGAYVGIECAREAAANCRAKGVPALVGDARRIPLRTDSMDVVTILDLLEHVDDDRAVLEECSRVLKPGGFLLVMVPAFMALWTSFDDYSFHKRRYSRGRLVRLLRDSGFVPARKGYMFSFLFPVLLFNSLLERIRPGKPDRGQGWRRRLAPPRPWVNGSLSFLGKLETMLMRRGLVPFGTTFLAICRNVK